VYCVKNELKPLLQISLHGIVDFMLEESKQEKLSLSPMVEEIIQSILNDICTEYLAGVRKLIGHRRNIDNVLRPVVYRNIEKLVEYIDLNLQPSSDSPKYVVEAARSLALTLNVESSNESYSKVNEGTNEGSIGNIRTWGGRMWNHWTTTSQQKSPLISSSNTMTATSSTETVCSSLPISSENTITEIDTTVTVPPVHINSRIDSTSTGSSFDNSAYATNTAEL